MKLLLVFLFVIVHISAGPFSCKPTVAGKAYDFTSLNAKNGSYTWKSSVDGKGPFYWQLQVCGDISNQTVASCKTPSPVNQISGDLKTCTSLGDSNVHSWDPTPYDDGVILTYYHGAYFNNIASYSSLIYIVCGEAAESIFVEHSRSCKNTDNGLLLGGQFHFKIVTPLAC